MASITFCRRPQVERRTGDSRTTIYRKIAQGLLTRPVPLGSRAVGWPDHEIDAINEARWAGASEADIRALVDRLHQARNAGSAAV